MRREDPLACSGVVEEVTIQLVVGGPGFFLCLQAAAPLCFLSSVSPRSTALWGAGLGKRARCRRSRPLRCIAFSKGGRICVQRNVQEAHDYECHVLLLRGDGRAQFNQFHSWRPAA